MAGPLRRRLFPLAPVHEPQRHRLCRRLEPRHELCHEPVERRRSSSRSASASPSAPRPRDAGRLDGGAGSGARFRAGVLRRRFPRALSGFFFARLARTRARDVGHRSRRNCLRRRLREFARRVVAAEARDGTDLEAVVRLQGTAPASRTMLRPTGSVHKTVTEGALPRGRQRRGGLLPRRIVALASARNDPPREERPWTNASSISTTISPTAA